MDAKQKQRIQRKLRRLAEADAGTVLVQKSDKALDAIGTGQNLTEVLIKAVYSFPRDQTGPVEKDVRQALWHLKQAYDKLIGVRHFGAQNKRR